MSTLLAVAHSPQALLPYLSEGSAFALDVVSDVRELSARIHDTDAEDAPSVIVIELHDHDAGPIAQVVRSLRQRFPRTPLVMMCTEDAPGNALFRAARAGAEHFVFLPKDDLGRFLTKLVSSAPAVTDSHDAGDDGITAGLDRPVRRVFDAILRAPRPHESVAALAASLGISTRTFERRAARQGWPAPRELLLWGRIVRGAAAVSASTSGNRLDILLDASGFRSAEHAAQAFARLADAPLTAVLAQGSRAVEPALVAAFSAPRMRVKARHPHQRSSAA
jgi:CheY-like chemotaxis protein